MKDNFSIDIEWMESPHGPAEVHSTFGQFTMVAGGHTITRVEDERSRSIRSHVYLAAYPLALWMASSWWRLRWEPAFDRLPSTDWQMSHRLTAPGSGYLWPPVQFTSDGLYVDIECRGSVGSPCEPISYLSLGRSIVPAPEFEQAIDEFIHLVVSRLDTVGIRGTPLHAIWRDVIEERADPAASSYRKLEAELGFDPDDAPPDLIARFQDLSESAGAGAVDEIAAGCSGADPGSALELLITRLGSSGAETTIPSLPHESSVGDQGAVPWERGRYLAQIAREYWKIDGPVTTPILAELLSITERILLDNSYTGDRTPAGLAVRSGNSGRVTLFLRKKNPTGRRFEVARLIAECIAAPPGDAWLPSTDSKTARQKMQRAFATEFLCPADDLLSRLSGQLSEEAIDDASAHFGVSSLAVKRQLENAGMFINYDYPASHYPNGPLAPISTR